MNRVPPDRYHRDAALGQAIGQTTGDALDTGLKGLSRRRIGPVQEAQDGRCLTPIGPAI
jgi:hypothetical protein